MSVDPARWQVLSPYLDEGLDLPPEARRQWLEGLRAKDPALAAELQALLDEGAALSREGFLAGTLAPVSEASLAGNQVGAYTLVSPLGRGGMGTVWLAERSDGRFSGRAAVKLLNVALIGHAGEERFKREGSILARLTHPHIAHLIDAGVTPAGQPFLVIELVEGEHIDRYCATRSLDVEARLGLFLAVLDAVSHAHANLIVHRDLKPSNVLVRRDGTVKLLDFGIAKLLQEDSGASSEALTVEGARVLTPEYAAPEQLTGEPVTTATDVYALGMLLYVLLGAPHPAGGRTASPADQLKAILETEPPRLSDVAPGGRALRGDLDTIVARALKKRPAERYPSVTAFADDLRRHLRDEPVSARPDTIVYRTSKFLRRHLRAAAAAAATLVMVAALITFYTVRLSSERDRARVEAEKSARIASLLTSLLAGADPYATRDREPTVRNLLDAGAERVRAELADQPELRAEMLTVIGRVYQRLGLLDAARPLLDEALAIGRQLAPRGSVRLAQTLNDAGVLLRERGDHAGAGPLLEEALALRRRLLGDMDKDVAVTLVELGRAYEDGGDPGRAEPLFREALRVRRAVFGDEHRETSTSKAELALLLLRQSEVDAAEPLFREALATSRAILGEDHPNTGVGFNNLGLALLDRADYAGAEPLFRRALAVRRRHFGERHPSIASHLNNLGVALREQGKLDEAARVIDEAVAVGRTGEGRDPNLPIYLFNRGRVLMERSEHAAAVAALREALALQQAGPSPADWRVAATKSALGGSLAALGELDQAAGLLTEASAGLRDRPGRQGREFAATRQRIASLQDAIRRRDQATRLPAAR